MAMFNSYVKLPEGIYLSLGHCKWTKPISSTLKIYMSQLYPHRISYIIIYTLFPVGFPKMEAPPAFIQVMDDHDLVLKQPW